MRERAKGEAEPPGLKTTWTSRTGSIQQLAYVRPLIYTEGLSANLRAWEVKSGDLYFRVMADKCLDIADLTYKGMNMTFLSKPGLQGRNHYDTNGQEAGRSIMGGLFFTCGLENICAPCTVDEKAYPMHGRLRSTPAEHTGADARFVGNDYVITIKGEMREAELFGENMVLRRTIETSCSANSIQVTDEIENQAFSPQPLMILYHCNLGYPFLDEACELALPTRSVAGREPWSEDHKDRWSLMDPPKENEPEYVFIHDLRQGEQGETMAMVVNHEKEVALCLEYNKGNLPYFMEWKSTAAGDYVLGLEPSNSSVHGRLYHIRQHTVHTLNPFESEINRLKFTVLEGKKAIGQSLAKIESMGRR